MNIVHISTDVSGGAGAFAKSVHFAMQRLGMKSLLLTREGNSIDGAVTVKPLTNLDRSLRAWKSTLLDKIGIIDNKYAMFGIEKSPVNSADIQRAMAAMQPEMFIFYWTSYFVSSQCMHELRLAYPEVPFVLICLDEGYIGGGCHYSWGCRGYEQDCGNCPATASPFGKRRIRQEASRRQDSFRSINPVIVYPSTQMSAMGKRSSILKGLNSLMIPVGAVWESERASVRGSADRLAQRDPSNQRRLTVLVRSSREYRKGCDILVGSLKILDEKLPNLRESLQVVTVGDTMLKEAGIDNYVDHEYLGIISREDLISLYSRVDGLIVTSREDAGPLMINECVALGKFVISTPVGVARDLITDSGVGLVIDDITSVALCAGIEVYIDRNKAMSSGTTANRIDPEIRSGLTFEEYAKTLLDAIRVPCR